MIRFLVFALCCFFMVVNGMGVSYAAEPIKLKYSNYLPPTNPFAKLGEDFIKEIQKRTNDKVEIKYYPGGILTAGPDVIGGIEHEVCDIGLSHVGYTRGRFPVTETLNLPFGYSSSYVGTQVMNDFYERFRPKEWDSVHVLYHFAPGPQILSTKKRAVRKLEDIQGLKIRASGRLADVVTNLGGTPVGISMGETYEGLQRGTIDGIVDARDPWKSFKLGELVKICHADIQNQHGIYFLRGHEQRKVEQPAG